jgi:hypothetical protein
MADEWLVELDDYFDSLEASLEQLGDCFLEFHQLTVSGDFQHLERPTQKLRESLPRLEELLDQRTQLLLRATHGHARPRSLVKVLQQRDENDRLVRAKRLGDALQSLKYQATSQFVTHFHLAELGKELIQVLTRSGPQPGTYALGGQATRSSMGGGGLINEAA